MSLFVPLQPQPKAFENITLANGKALCSSHQEDLNSLYLNRKLFGSYNNIAACSKCTRPINANTNLLAAFRGYSASQCCVVSPNLSQRPLAQTLKNPCLNFGNDVMEHVLWDMKSDGYELKSLVYMKDQKVLAACSKNGSVCFWSIGDSVELIQPKLNLEKKINFAKYCMISDGKKCLAIGTDKGVHVYNMAEEGSYIRLLGVIDEEKVVSDLDFLKDQSKIVTVYDESIAKIWNLDTLEMEKVVDLHQYGIKGKIQTVMYLERTGELAIEHEKGLSVIKDWQNKDAHVRHHFVNEKKSFGCKYLPNSRVFIMNNCSYVEILKEEDFEEVRRHVMQTGGLFGNDRSSKKFLTSQDESVIIANSGLSQIHSYKEENYVKHHLNHFIWGGSDVELMEDQYRIAVANPSKGVVTIFRVNANINIERSEGLSSMLAVSSSEQQFDAPGGGSTRSLFSGGGTPAGGLFSGGGGGSARGPPSGGGSGGGLFLRNSNPYSRNPLPSRVNNVGLFNSKPNKKSTTAKPKPASKPAKKGKKIQKVQLGSNATKKKEKVVPSSSVVKKEKNKTKKSKSLKKQNKNMIEAVRIKGTKKTKEEKVWIVLPSKEDDEKKRGRSLKKATKREENKSSQKGKRKTDLSKDKGSRSRSKSKSVTRKK